MEDGCLYAYNVIKIEEPNRLPYYSPVTIQNDIETLIPPSESVLADSWYCLDGEDSTYYYIDDDASDDCDLECLCLADCINPQASCNSEDIYLHNNIHLNELDGLPGVTIDYNQMPPTIVMPDYILECHELAYLDDPNYENNWSEFFDGLRIRFDNALRLLPTDKQAELKVSHITNSYR